jgi:hypothetical protein
MLTVARLVLELRRRAGGDALHRGRMRQILAELRELAASNDQPDSGLLREILGAVLVVHGDLELEGRALEALTPETVLRLDAVLTALVDGTMQRDELRAELRRAMIRPAS